MTKIIEGNKESWESEVLNSHIPVVVDFWAVWCAPCSVIASVINELAPALDGLVKFVKIDADHNHDLCVNYRVRSIPTLMLFVDGKVRNMNVGAIGAKQLEEWIRKAL